MMKKFKLLTGVELSDKDISDIIIDFCYEKQNNLRDFTHQIIDHENYCKFVLTLIHNDAIDRVVYVKKDDYIPIAHTYYDSEQDAYLTTEDDVHEQLFTYYYFIFTPYNGDSIYVFIKRAFDCDTNEYIGEFHLDPKLSFLYDTHDTVYNYWYQP